jgi:hypothetical protein
MTEEFKETETSIREEFFNNNKIKGWRCICCEWKTLLIHNARKYLIFGLCDECKEDLLKFREKKRRNKNGTNKLKNEN